MDLNLFEKIAERITENDEIQNFINELKESLENITNKISDKLLNKNYERAEQTLQEYFEGKGIRRYNELLEGDFDNRANYVLVTKGNNEKAFYGSNTTEDISNPIKIECFNDIKYPVVFSLKNGKVEVNEELSRKYEEMQEKIEKGEIKRNSVTIIDKIENESATSLDSSSKIIQKRNQIIGQYAKDTINEGSLYFVLHNNYMDENYQALKYEGEEGKRFGVLEMELPEGAGVNTVMRVKDNKYIIDEEATEIIEKQINESANEILNKQNKYLETCRIEGELYCISEDVYDRVYLKNLNTNEEFEEVDYPKELFGEANLGDVVKYEDGKYTLITKSKYQKEVGVKENNHFGNEKQEGTLYCVSEEEYYISLINLNNGEEFEVLDFPEELKTKITEGTILIYENGEYRLK